MMRKIYVSILTLMSLSAVCRGESFEEVRALALGNETVLDAGVSVCGTVVSDYRSYNAENAPNTAWNKVDLSVPLSTVYIQSEDGRYGFRVVLDDLYSNKYERGTEVRLDLSGAVLERSEEPQAYTIRHPRSVEVLSRGKGIPAKTVRLEDLKDEDIYTLVTIPELEYLNKQGSFLNIYELCAQQNQINRLDAPFHSCDAWASMLMDGNGNHIYMQLNSKVDWRRNTLDFPQGRGSVTGVLVCSGNRRYGISFGRYSIRPVFREDIAISADPGTAYETVASWRWDRNYHHEINFVENGPCRWLDRKSVRNDAVRAESGEGRLYSTCGAYISLDVEYDSRHATDAGGMAGRAAGALRMDGNTAGWYNFENGELVSTNAIIVETSTSGVSGSGLVFNFSMLAGNHSARLSYGFPAFWTLKYSTDGTSWIPAGFDFELRPVAFRRCLYEKVFYPTPYDAAAGFPEFSVRLPSDLLGKEKLYLSLSPANDILTGIHEDPSHPVASERMVNGYDHPFCIRIGMVELKAY